MKRITLALAAALAFAGHAQADEALAKKYNCTACHALDKKLVGPAYKDVAAKYNKEKDTKKTEAALFDKVKKGSMGVWGPVPMPPNGAVPDEDIKKLVKWVLAVK
jgi:cytochrome c